MSVTKAVIPAAGLGTRFLPATKATPKEMLPVVDKPAVQYVVEEAAAAGLRDILVITGRNKKSLEDHFDRAVELEHMLEAKGDRERLALVRAPSELATLHFVRQGDALGLGHAIGCARDHVGDQSFAVLLGDDLIDARNPVLPTMLDVQQHFGGVVLLLMEVEREQIRLYGSVAVEPSGRSGVFRVTDLVEKPEPADAPSSYAVIGRYVLPPEIFAAIERTNPGRGGEIQLTDAVRALAIDGAPVHGVVLDGWRYDTGDRADYLRTVVRMACERSDIGPEFLAWLRAFVAEHDEAERLAK